jgi:hypothetical protein
LEFAADGFGEIKGAFHIHELNRGVIAGGSRPPTGLMKAGPSTNILGTANVEGSIRTHEDVYEHTTWKRGRRVDRRKVGVHVGIPKDESLEPFDFAQGTR